MFFSGVEVHSKRYSSNDLIYDFNIDGTVNATGAAFVEYMDLNVRNGGVLNLTNTSVSGSNPENEDSSLSYASGSAGNLRYATLNVPLSLSAAWTGSIRESDFSSSSVTASGGSTTTIDLTSNWWGTTDPAEIEAKIWHQPDDAGLPLVLYDPWLHAVPSERLLYVLEMWPEGPINWRTNYVDVTFNREVDLATLTLAHASVESRHLTYDVVSINKVGDTTYRLALDTELPEGTHRLELGPEVADAAGNLMNQDFDDQKGEPLDDMFLGEEFEGVLGCD